MPQDKTFNNVESNSVDVSGDSTLVGKDITTSDPPATESQTGGGLTSNGIYYGDGSYSGYQFSFTSDVNKAITDAGRNGRDVVLPASTGVTADATISLPDEPAFSLLCPDGPPEITHPSGNGLTHVIEKPSTSNRNYGLRLGPFHITDNDGTLNPAISIKDVKESVIEPGLAFDCPILELRSDANTFCNQNKILWPFTKADLPNRKASVTFSGNDGTADQNWILFPHFAPANATNSNPESIAYEDHGAFNQWIGARAENADIVYNAVGAREYYISSNGWDRTQYINRTVVESTNAEGTAARGYIEVKDTQAFASFDLLSPTTQFRVRGKHWDRPNPRGVPTDFGPKIKNRLGGQTLSNVGFDTSNLDDTGVLFERQKVDFNAPGNGSAHLSTGDSDNKATNALPKMGCVFGPLNTGGSTDDDDDVVARMGFNSPGTGEFAELVYDPGQSLSYSPSSNWFLAVNDGTVSVADTGVGGAASYGPANMQIPMTLNVINTGSGGPGDLVTGCVGTSREQINAHPAGQGELRWYVEATTSASKTWRLSQQHEVRAHR